MWVIVVFNYIKTHRVFHRPYSTPTSTVQYQLFNSPGAHVIVSNHSGTLFLFLQLTWSACNSREPQRHSGFIPQLERDKRKSSPESGRKLFGFGFERRSGNRFRGFEKSVEIFGPSLESLLVQIHEAGRSVQVENVVRLDRDVAPAERDWSTQ